MDLTITCTRGTDTITYDSVYDPDTDTYTVTVTRLDHDTKVRHLPPADWRTWMLTKLHARRAKGWLDDYRDCDFTHSHTRNWCYHQLCRVA